MATRDDEYILSRDFEGSVRPDFLYIVWLGID